MATGRKAENPAFQKLKQDLAAEQPATLYVFYGEEDYLRQYYLKELRKICGGPFDAFDTLLLDGEQVDPDSLRDAVDSIPMGGGRKLIILRDYKAWQPTGAMKDALPELLENLPPYVCLVIDCESVEFKPDKRLAAYKALEKYGQLVEFRQATSADLIPWIKRRFQALGKGIETRECEYLIFLCGASMTNLAGECEKIAAGTGRQTISHGDIEALASRALEADVFALTDCILQGNYEKGLGLLRDLFDMKNEPVAILASVSRQLQRLYGARLALEQGKGEAYVAELFGFRSTYPAKLLLQSARRCELGALRRIQELCLAADLGLKSNLPDPARTVELLLMQVAQEVRP